MSAARNPGILSDVRNLERLRQIVAVLVRHGFGELVRRTSLGNFITNREGDSPPQKTVAERARMVLEELGPSFVKLGQILSTRPDLIPPDILLELKKLQDQVPPIPLEQVLAAVEEELGKPVSELFTRFDEVPLASASIGQVHRASFVDREGATQEVVVKVQRPGIKQVIERDIDLLYFVARMYEKSSADAYVYAPVRSVSEFERAITAELDFTLEADHAVRFAKNFEGKASVRFPHIYRSHSSKRVLTLEFFDGHKVYDAIRHGYDPNDIARLTLQVLIKAIFEDGFFHADPHPGNVIVMGTAAAPVMGLIDLGLVGRLTPQLRDRTVDLLVAAVREDYAGMSDALYAIGTPSSRVDRRAFEADTTVLAQKYLGKQLGDIELSALIRDLVWGATKYGIEIPPDFLMVGKAMMTLEGIGRELAPEFDIFEEMKPYFLQIVAQRYSPERVAHEFMRQATRIGSAASDLPVQAQEVLEDLRRGKLEIRTRDLDALRVMDILGRRLYSGFVVAGLLLGSAVLIAQNKLLEGLIFAAASMFWGSGHTMVAWWVGRKKER